MARDRWYERDYDYGRDRERGMHGNRDYDLRRELSDEDRSDRRGEHGRPDQGRYPARDYDQGFGQGGYGGGHGRYGQGGFPPASRGRYGRSDRRESVDLSRAEQPWDEGPFGYDFDPAPSGRSDFARAERESERMRHRRHEPYGRPGPSGRGEYHGQDYRPFAPEAPSGQGYHAHHSRGPGGYPDLGRGAWEQAFGHGSQPDYGRYGPGATELTDRGRYHGQDFGQDVGRRYEQGGYGRDQYGRAEPDRRGRRDRDEYGRDRERRSWRDF